MDMYEFISIGLVTVLNSIAWYLIGKIRGRDEGYFDAMGDIDEDNNYGD